MDFTYINACKDEEIDMSSSGQSQVGPIIKEYRLFDDNELRIEVADENVIIELLEGAAEIFGTSLSLHKRYTFPPAFRAAIFTYKGALVEVVGKTESAYIAQQTPMVMYLNTHFTLETLREKVAAELESNPSGSEARGPRIMISGPMDVGKSTLCRILCNYAVRQNRTPIYVDLNVSQHVVALPGSIGALYVEKPADIIDNFDTTAAYVYNFGHLSPSANIVHYDMLVKELAAAVNKKCKASTASNVGGVVINTFGWIKGEGYQSMVNAADVFSVDVVIVLDHERLYSELQRDLPSFVKVLHFPKSGGVESRSAEYRSLLRQRAIHKYFYGSKTTYFPHTFEISYDKPADEQELLVAKVGAEMLPDSCLPYGMKVDDHRTMVVSVPISAALTNHLLALLPPDCNTIDQYLMRKNVIGFVVVQNVDTARKTITILSPQRYPLPSRIALYSEVTYIDE